MSALFKKLIKYEGIHYKGRLYLHRWHLFRLGSYCVYLHKFVDDDFSRDLHDHPKRFISIGLKRGYVEQTRDGIEVFLAPWIRSFPAEHVHRLALLPDGKPCWTLVITLGRKREWGFHTPKGWVPWKEYLNEARKW